MIKVLIENLEFKAVIGILDFERINPQKIKVNASLESDEFIDYAKVCDEIQKIFKNQKFKTVEESLKFCEFEFKKKYKTLKYFYMKIIKINIIHNAHVGAEIEMFY